VPLECAGCHVDPHAGRRWTAEADAPAAAAPAAEPPAPPTHPPSASRDCARCHVTAAWERLRPGVAGFDHRRTGFPLRGAHAALLCDRCHAGSATSGEAAARGGGASARGAARAACASCHADPHRGEQGTSCEQCHSERSFRAEDGLTRHRATRFPLTGAHASAECGACHLERASGRFTPLPTECGACHLRDYLATTNPNHAATGFSTRCEECHRPTVWSAAKVYHDRFFPLTGAHAAVACASCHPGGRYAGTPRDCFGCHAADYGAAANPNHAQSGFGTDCQSCHGESSWRPATFDHERFFPLRSGPHSRFRNDCNACHPQPSNRSVFTCTTCHQRNDTDREHRNEPGYRYADADCYRCHPQGRH
jgi:hypothetical protein